MENEAVVKIKELKYLKNIGGEYVSVKYEGFLDCLRNNPSATLPRQIAELKLHDPEHYEEGKLDSHKNNWKLKEKLSLAITISSTGRTLFIGAPRKTDHHDLGKIYEDVECSHLQGGGNTIPQHYKPQIYELCLENKNHVKFGEKDFTKYFTILERRVYVCTIGDHGFYEIQHEIVSRFNVKELLFTEHINVEHVYTINLQNEMVGVRFKEIKRFLISTGKAVSFTGKDNGIHYNLVAVSSSTFSHDNKIDIAYKLSALGDVYRTFISSEGYDIRIGSHYKATVEAASVKCVGMEDYKALNSEGALDTKIKVKINKHDMTYAMIGVNVAGFFEKTTTEVWKCKKNTTQDRELYIAWDE